jgi:hypothetical protein
MPKTTQHALLPSAIASSRAPFLLVLEATVEEGDPRSGLKDVMEI